VLFRSSEPAKLGFNSLDSDSDGPPYWRKKSNHEAILCRRKTDGTGSWSDLEKRALERFASSLEGALIGEFEGLTIDDALEILRRGKKEMDEKLPHIPEIVSEDDRDSREVMSSAAEEADHESDLNSEVIPRSGRGYNEEAVRKLSRAGSSRRPMNPGTRQMSEVTIEPRRPQRMPTALAGSAAILNVKARSEQERPGNNKGRFAPSISTPFAQNQRGTRTVQIQTPRRPDNSNNYNQAGPDQGPDSGSDSDSPGSNKSRRNHFARTPGPGRRKGSPGGSSSDGSGSSRSRSGGRKKRRHSRTRHDYDSDNEYDHNLKMKHPESYDGKPDLELFDGWMNSIITYADVMKIREKTMIKLMSSYVTGNAQLFYSRNVSGKFDRWTYETLFSAMFDYCFPQEIMRKLRKRWNSASQGKQRVREYIRELELLAARFSEINERTVALKFWEGLNWELREKMCSDRADPELDTLEELIEKAYSAEKGRDQRNFERSQNGDNGKRPQKKEWSRFKNRSGGNPNQRPKESDGRPNPSRSERIRANALSPQNAPSQRPRSNQQQKQPPKLSRAKMDALRAEGKCFNCQEKGHEQRNCPRLNSMKPPKPMIKAGSISIAKMDKIAEQMSDEENDDIYVGSISVMTPDPIANELREFEAIEKRVHQLCEETWGADPLWYNEETRLDARWSVVMNEREIEVWDFELDRARTIPRDVIEDPNFKIADIFDANSPPNSVREGGYPDAENYQRWEWPAINWMLARFEGYLDSVNNGEMPTDILNRIDIMPIMLGYSIRIIELNVYYNITHEEVLNRHFKPERIINQMVEAAEIPVEQRKDRFRNKRLKLTNDVMIRLGMASVPGQKPRKRGGNKLRSDPEGANAIERTTLRIKDKTRRLPETIVVEIKINGQPMRALLDSGSMADFISTKVVDQLKLPKEIYPKPLPVQLAVHGSRSKVNCGTTVQFQYQIINCEKRFDVVNLDNYDAILGTPFLYQHQVAIAFNPSRVVVGSREPLEIKGPDVMTIKSAAADLLDEGLETLRIRLRKEAEDLCPDTSKTELPPIRAVNHTIPLIDESKIYRFRPSKCPEAFRDQWKAKKDAYIKTGRWQHATGHNAIPLLMIPKMSSSGGRPTLRTVFDKREQNANTFKLASPLPDIEEILREVSRHKYRSLIDGKDAYEQIRVVPEHVSRTIFTTPDGTMTSRVMQQGDCNAGATYQTLMNHIFGPYIGVFVYVYLDDIIIFSDSINEHVEHLRIVSLGANPQLPSGYIVGTLWFPDQSTQHLPTRYILITFVMYSPIHPAKALQIQADFFCKAPSPVPSGYI